MQSQHEESPKSKNKIFFSDNFDDDDIYKDL